MVNNHQQLQDSLYTGFIDHQKPSYQPYWPNLIVNDKKEGKKVLTTLLHELDNCQEFWMSVAFITTNGVATLLQKLLELADRGVKGRILVSQYLNFTQPEALRRLLQLKNIELKIATEGSFHSKGFLFKKNTYYSLMIGSSNLTANALCTNIEWNLTVTATEQSHIIKNAIKTFTIEFEKAITVDESFIANYQILYNKQIDYSKLIKDNMQSDEIREIVPNAMQLEALLNLEVIRQEGKNKALLISATGTGKTYLSAFDVKKFNPKKFLFVVHRRNIAEAAMKTFQTLFGTNKSMGIYSGDRRDLHSDFIFATVQTISSDEHINKFSKDHFDYIVIDESHRSGANSYKRVIEYFNPKFLLGMTATPERTDGADIFKLFDYNIAYEIRLHQALDQDILSPFHYYGIADITINNELLNEEAKFTDLTSNERIERILEKAHLYGSDNGNIRGLIFCSSVDEARKLSAGINKQGLKTIALSGEDSELRREQAMKDLESDALDYILTVDIFNEGIDIPSVNQIIMLRPTQSAIIFVQQLGRGLRKIKQKDYLTVIDFIGNYKNNFMVPIALYGDTTYNKDTIRKLMTSGSSLIPGTSTINFDLISRNKIFEAINSTNMQMAKDLRKDYDLLRMRLGRMPMMLDFLQQGSRDPQQYVNSNNSKSYYEYISRIEEGYRNKLNAIEKKVLGLFSREINNAKRVEECLVLEQIIEHGKLHISIFEKRIQEEYGYGLNKKTLQSAIDNLNFKFATELKNKKLLPIHEIYKLSLFDINDQTIIPTNQFKELINNETFRLFLLDSTQYSISAFNQEYQLNKFNEGFVLYRKYTRKDVFRILNWKSNPLAQGVGGYMMSQDQSNCALFVNYHKDDDITLTTQYEDEFINHSQFKWMSKSKRKLNSPEIVAFKNQNKKIRLPLFVKKSNVEGAEFYYMGELTPIMDSFEQTTINNDKGGTNPIVQVVFNLNHAVEPSLFEYITTNNKKEERTTIIQKPTKNLNKPSKVAHSTASLARIPSFSIIDSEFVNPYVNAIPLIKAAAGSFINFNVLSDLTWVEKPASLKKGTDYFICEVKGESMNRKIPNGSFCLFRRYTGGTKEGEIVLVQFNDIQNGDFGTHYTIKKYHSVKNKKEEGNRYESITLEPLSYDDSFKAIQVTNDGTTEFEVLGIFEQVL
jgi:superfamily II DNA or RNA helicase/SOS-response transcriptional repressor LexA